MAIRLRRFFLMAESFWLLNNIKYNIRRQKSFKVFVTYLGRAEYLNNIIYL